MSLTMERPPEVAAQSPTRMVIRRFRTAPRDLLAIMVDRVGTSEGTCKAYSNAYQHTEVRYASIIPITIAPYLNDADVINMIDEIKDLGYMPKIIIKYSRPG